MKLTSIKQAGEPNGTLGANTSDWTDLAAALTSGDRRVPTLSNGAIHDVAW